MSIVEDFRDYPFARSLVRKSGRYLGRHSYWKLYAIENFLRVMLHSILSVQIAVTWWDTAVDKNMKKDVERTKRAYAKKPFHTSPGKHEIYYLYLSDLNKIMVANSNLFLPVVPDIDSWIRKIEGIRIPRNLVGHMNFPNQTDRERIDKLYRELGRLVAKLDKKGFRLQIP